MYATILLGYFLLLVMLGISRRRMKPGIDSFFFGERKLGSFWIFFTVTASWFGAAATIATIEASLKDGFRAAWLLGIPTVVTILLFIGFNKKIRQSRFISLPDFLDHYYGKTVRASASLLVFLYMATLAASQLVAWGSFIGPFLGQGYEWAIVIGAAIIIFYSFAGGYSAVVRTDALQLILLMTAILFLTLFQTGKPKILPGDVMMLTTPSYHLLMCLSFVLAWFISPIIWQRVASARSTRASYRGLWLSVVVFSILYFIVILIGIKLRSVSSSSSFAVIVRDWLPATGSLLVFIGIAAAIMSTSDSAINIAALTLVKDVFNIGEEKRIIFWARFFTLVSGILTLAIAFQFRSIIKTLGLASEIMAEGLFVPGMAALLWQKKSPKAGLLSLSFGGGFAMLVFVNSLTPILPLPAWPYSVPIGLSLSTIGFISGLWIDRSKKIS